MKAEVGQYGGLVLIPDNDADRAWLRRWERMDISTGGCAILTGPNGSCITHMVLEFRAKSSVVVVDDHACAWDELQAVAKREGLIRELGLNEEDLDLLSDLKAADHKLGHAGEIHQSVGLMNHLYRLKRLRLLRECDRDAQTIRYRITALGKELVD